MAEGGWRMADGGRMMQNAGVCYTPSAAWTLFEIRDRWLVAGGWWLVTLRFSSLFPFSFFLFP